MAVGAGTPLTLGAAGVGAGVSSGATAAAVVAGGGVMGAAVVTGVVVIGAAVGRVFGVLTPAPPAAGLSAHGPAVRKRQQSSGARQDGPVAVAAAAAAAVEVQHRPWPCHTIS